MSIPTALAIQAFFNDASPSAGTFRTEPRVLLVKMDDGRSPLTPLTSVRD